MEGSEATNPQTVNTVCKLLELLTGYFQTERQIVNVPRNKVLIASNLYLWCLISLRSTLVDKIFEILIDNYPFYNSTDTDNPEEINNLQKKFFCLVKTADTCYDFKPNSKIMGTYTKTLMNLIIHLKVTFELHYPPECSSFFLDDSEMNEKEKNLYDFLIAAQEFMQIETIIKDLPATQERINSSLLLTSLIFRRNRALQILNSLKWQEQIFEQPRKYFVEGFIQVFENLKFILDDDYNPKNSGNLSIASRESQNIFLKLKELKKIIMPFNYSDQNPKFRQKITVSTSSKSVTVYENTATISYIGTSTELSTLYHLILKVKDMISTNQTMTLLPTYSTKIFNNPKGIIVLEEKKCSVEELTTPDKKSRKMVVSSGESDETNIRKNPLSSSSESTGSSAELSTETQNYSRINQYEEEK